MIDALAEAVRARIVAVERGASQLRTQRGALPMPADFELFAPHGAFNSLATTARDLRLHAAIAAVARLLGRPELASPESRDAADLLLLTPDWTVTGTVADLLEARTA